MLKKFISFPIIICMFIVQAHAATNNGIKAAFDDLNYALTVEWDQTDRTFYNAQLEKFTAQLKGLQDNGLTNQELVQFAVSQMKDEKTAKDLETALNMVQVNKLSSNEAQKYVRDVMNKSYSQGASWSGNAVVGVIAVILIIAVAAVVAGKARVGEGCYEVYTCEDYCTGNLCYEECDYECVN